MLIAFVLPYKIKAIVVIVEANKRLHQKNEIRQIVCVFDLLTILSFDPHIVHK